MPTAECIVNATLGSDEVLPSADGHFRQFFIIYDVNGIDGFV